MRILYYVPIIHAASDQGSFGQAIVNARTQRLGQSISARMEQKTHMQWKEIIRKVQEALPDPRDVFVYQDSLCIELKEEVIRALRARTDFESPNDRLLKELMDKGAIIEGTECLKLVGEFIGIFKEIARAITPLEQNRIFVRHESRILELLKARDEFIAKRIHDTLPEDKKGILFLGRNHDVISELEKLPRRNFTVIYI